MLDLNELDNGLPGITPIWGSAMVEVAIECLVSQGHAPGVRLATEGGARDSRVLTWIPLVDVAHANRAWADRQEATEYGATAIAVLLAKVETGYTVVERSVKGTGFDYWMGRDTKDPPFQNKARLEISGILKAEGNNAAVRREVTSRVNQKVQQVARSGLLLPAYVIVVEVGTPLAKVHKT